MVHRPAGTASPAPNPHPISCRPAAAAQFLGISRATLWRWVAERHDFPRPRRLSARCTVFDLGELVAWRDAHINRAA